jgi:hypothetical protein
MSINVTEADLTAVLAKLGDPATAGRPLVLPAADLALGASETLARLGSNQDATACLLATVTQESAHFRAVEEYDKTGSYKPFWGRGLIQLTWRSNYEAFGRWSVEQGWTATPDLFVKRPELLLGLGWEWRTALFFVGAKDLWTVGLGGDFQRFSVLVNGRRPFPAGWAARLAAYRAWCSLVAKRPALTVDGVRGPATLTRLQQWVGVKMTGVWDLGTVQGVQQWLGRPLTAALSGADCEALQRTVGAHVDGVWGPGTTRDLQTYLNQEA